MPTLVCPECLANLKLARDPERGKAIRCPKCGQTFLADDAMPDDEDDGRDIDQSDPRNPSQKLGVPRVACGMAAITLGSLGLIHGALNLVPVALAVVTGFVVFGRGLMFLLQPLFWPARAPAGILGHYRDIAPLLERLPNDQFYLGTYQPPRGLFQLLTRLVFPQYNYLTPPVRPLFNSVGGWALALAASLPVCFAFAYVGSFEVGLVLSATFLAALSAQALALHLCSPRVPKTPQVDITKVPTLTKAGNPKALFDNIVQRELDVLRDGDPNRRFNYYARDTGNRQRITEFDGEVALESQPDSVPLSDGISSAASLLDWAGVCIACAGWATVLVVPPAGNHAVTKLFGLVPVAVGMSVMRAAYGLRNTFRFRSTLLTLRFKGTIHAQAAGGEGAGFGTVERLHSELHVTITATNVLTECTAASRTVHQAIEQPDAEAASRQARSALSSPRYILEATCDGALRQKVGSLAKVLQDYRDSHGEVMGADEGSEGARAAIDAKLARERQKMLLEHQLHLQADMQSQLFAKMLEKMSPDQLQQVMLAESTGGSLPNPLQVSPIPPPVDGEKLVRQAIRSYLTPGQSPDVMAANKRILEQLCKQYRITAQRLNEMIQFVKAEMK